MTFSSLFGERLKEARNALGLNQAQVADLVGVSREYWGRCERGGSVPGGEVLAKLAQAGADVAYILTGTRSQPVPPAEELPREEAEWLRIYRYSSPEIRAVLKAAGEAATKTTKRGDKAA